MTTDTDKKHHEDTIPFFPDHAMTEVWVAVGVLAVVAVIAVLGQMDPVGLQDPADPFNTPLHIKPEWYFLFLYQMLKYVPKTAGALLPIIGVAIIVIWPFLDRNKEDSKRARMMRIVGVVAFFLFAIILTIMGEIS